MQQSPDYPPPPGHTAPPGYQAPHAYQPEVPTHLVWAILTTLFCCLPLGIVSIVYATKVKTLMSTGAIDAAREASRKAKLWAIWSAVTEVVVYGIWLLIMMIGELSGYSGYGY